MWDIYNKSELDIDYKKYIKVQKIYPWVAPQNPQLVYVNISCSNQNTFFCQTEIKTMFNIPKSFWET